MAKSVRQSVTIPGELAREIERGAKRRHATFSKALVDYARRGIYEEQRALEKLRLVVRKIQAALTEEEAAAVRYEDELVEAIFGPHREMTETHGPGFARGRRSDVKLEQLLREEECDSLSEYVKKSASAKTKELRGRSSSSRAKRS